MNRQYCGLLGRKLGHSFSKTIHNQLADYTYRLIELEPDALSDFFKKRDFLGLNITIPYKEAVLPFIDEMDARALRIGSVNTIVNRSGRLYGYNTDYDGLEQLLYRNRIVLSDRVVMILGNGGTSKTAVVLAADQGAREILRVSRKGEHGTVSYRDAAMQRGVQVLINATPAGMYPQNETMALDPSLFPQLEAVVDVVYNPLCTDFILRAKELRLIAANGLDMLVAQAKASAELFTGKTIRDEKTDEIIRALTLEHANCVLIAMPGAGKSIVGKRAASLLNKKFIDTDEEILKYTGKTPAALIEERGESAFREIESRVIEKIAKQGSLVIATGGGVVTRAENMRRLRQNGVILFMERDITKLATENRPLSSDIDKIRRSYVERYPLYKQYCDAKLDNNASIDAAAEQVKGAFYAHCCH